MMTIETAELIREVMLAQLDVIRELIAAQSAPEQSGQALFRDIPGYPGPSDLTAADRDILETMLELGASKQNGVPWHLIAQKAGYRSPKRHRLKAAGMIREIDGASRGMALTELGAQYAAELRDAEND